VPCFGEHRQQRDVALPARGTTLLRYPTPHTPPTVSSRRLRLVGGAFNAQLRGAGDMRCLSTSLKRTVDVRTY